MPDFERSVFINCPYDEGYMDLLRPMVFTVLRLGYLPRLALERACSAESRIHKIVDLIQSSKFGIHDLSRCVASRKGEYYRLNMPLELGIDYGCQRFMRGRAVKRILIMDAEPHRLRRALSDMSGSDIKVHRNRRELVVKCVRDWLVQEAGAQRTPHDKVYFELTEFESDLDERLLKAGWKRESIQKIETHELVKEMSEWLGLRPIR